MAWQYQRLPLLLACFLLLSGCFGLPSKLDQLQEPRVSLTRLAIQDLSLFNPSFLVNLSLDNPNDLDIGLRGADVTLALNGRPVAKGISRGPLVLASHGRSEMAVEVTADTLVALQQVASLSGQSALAYEVTGHLHVVQGLGPFGKLPFAFQGSVDRDTLLRGLGGGLGTLGKGL